MCTNLKLAFPIVDAGSPIRDQAPEMFVSSRCLEMPGVIEQSLYVVAAGEEFPLRPFPLALSHPHRWTASQDFVGIAPSGRLVKGGGYSSEMVWDVLPTFNDGINVAGLSVGALWLAPGTEYPAPGGTPFPEVSFLDFPAWVLSNFAAADDVRTALGWPGGPQPQVTIVGPPVGDRFYVPLHYIVTDRSGASIIVEFVGGETRIHDSETGVLANAPTYDWHHTNVKFYEHLSPMDNPTSTTGSGQPGASDLMGLPGDPTSPSRFLKAWCLRKGYGMLPPDGESWLPAPGGLTPKGAPAGYSGSEQTAVVTALQLVQLCMGTPYGMLVEKSTASSSLTYSDFTMWTSVRDHTNVNYYFMSAFSGVLTKIDLGAIEFSSAPRYPKNLTIAVLPQPGVGWCADATDQLVSA
jgi:choloylglycine hydrolase